MLTGPLPVEPLADGADDDEELVELPPPQAVASRPAVSRTAESAAPEEREILGRGRMRDPPSVSRRLAFCRRVSGGGSRLAASQPRGSRLGKTNRRIARIADIFAPARWPAPARSVCGRGEADLPDPHRDAARGPASAGAAAPPGRPRWQPRAAPPARPRHTPSRSPAGRSRRPGTGPAHHQRRCLLYTSPSPRDS